MVDPGRGVGAKKRIYIGFQYQSKGGMTGRKYNNACLPENGVPPGNENFIHHEVKKKGCKGGTKQ